jgi:hypothetical protein
VKLATVVGVVVGLCATCVALAVAYLNSRRATDQQDTIDRQASRICHLTNEIVRLRSDKDQAQSRLTAFMEGLRTDVQRHSG